MSLVIVFPRMCVWASFSVRRIVGNAHRKAVEML
jgi:hypothetical protein